MRAASDAGLARQFVLRSGDQDLVVTGRVSHRTANCPSASQTSATGDVSSRRPTPWPQETSSRCTSRSRTQNRSSRRLGVECRSGTGVRSSFSRPRRGRGRRAGHGRQQHVDGSVQRLVGTLVRVVARAYTRQADTRQRSGMCRPDFLESRRAGYGRSSRPSNSRFRAPAKIPWSPMLPS